MDETRPRVSRHLDGRAFLAAAEPFLLQREAENNLILGRAPAIARPSPDDPAPPYLATIEIGSETVACALRTPPHSLVVTRLPVDSAGPLAADIADYYADLPGVFGPEGGAGSFADTWSVRTGCSPSKVRSTRIYQIEHVLPAAIEPPGTLRLAKAADLELVTRWVTAFLQEVQPEESRTAAERAAEQIRSETVFLWETGKPASMAAWTGKTPNGVRVNLVYTPPTLRGKGYASACVGALSKWLLRRGNRFCFLFADLANPTSNRIYQRIGYRPVCEMQHYSFMG